MASAPKIPLKVEALPLYASEPELAKAILGSRAKDWKLVTAAYEHKGLPKINPLTCGRYVPAVLAFFEQLDGYREQVIPSRGVSDSEVAERWHKRKPRARRPAS